MSLQLSPMQQQPRLGVEHQWYEEEQELPRGSRGGPDIIGALTLPSRLILSRQYCETQVRWLKSVTIFVNDGDRKTWYRGATIRSVWPRQPWGELVRQSKMLDGCMRLASTKTITKPHTIGSSPICAPP